MKKFSLIFVFAFLLFSFTINVKAEAIKTIDADIKNGEITVSGEVEDGILAVQVLVYDESGKKEIIMSSTEVDENNKFSTKINVADGKYIVRVADYDGGNIKEVNVPKQEEEEKTPETSDNIARYVIISLIALMGLTTSIVLLKKRLIK